MVDLKASRLKEIGGEYYFSQKLKEIDILNAKGHRVLNLGIGNPDIPPSKEVETALSNSLNKSGYHQYQNPNDVSQLRKAFSNWYQNYFEVTLNPDTEVLPLIGSKEGITHITMTLLNNGEKVLIPNPGYPTYATITKLLGGDVIQYSLKESNGYHPNLEILERIDLTNVKIMWVNYPHMPTGADGSDELFDQLLSFSRKHQIVIVNDNPYGFILTKNRRSLLRSRQNSDLVLELNSLSKSHNMAGWRVGAILGNSDLIQAVQKIKSNVDSGHFKPIIRGAIMALDLPEEWYTKLNDIYRLRKNIVRDIVEKIGCVTRNEEVGMFMWIRIPSEFSNGKQFSDYLLNKYKIFMPPGSVFGSEGENFIRISLCNDNTIWQEVSSRINQIK